MKYHHIILLFALLILAVSSGFSRETGTYYERTIFLPAPATVYDDGLLGFINPANLAFMEHGDYRFYWSTEGRDAGSFQNWGFFSGLPHLGFGLQRHEYGNSRVMDYRLGFGFGSRSSAIGLAYGWSLGDKEFFDRRKVLTLGTVLRPFEFVSFSLLGNFSTEDSWNEGVAELGLRPLGTSRLTLFADAAYEKGMDVKDMPWSAGAAVEIVDGISLVGRYFEDEAFTIGMNIDFGKTGFSGRTLYDTDQNHAGYVYHVRAGDMRPSIFPRLTAGGDRYLPISLKGGVVYQKYQFFDKSIKFLDLLTVLQAAADDDQIGAVVLNLSGMAIYPEHAWEIRHELERIKNKGKKVIIFIDRVFMTSYHLASVADKIVLDPSGLMILKGFTSSKTYFKGTLEKLGLGFDEWRHFKYKSAAEVLVRDRYSEADREQNQDYVDDRYEHVRDEICVVRNLTHVEFDRIIDEQPLIMPDDAVTAGLVDTLGRWSDKDKIIKPLIGKNSRAIGSGGLLPLTMRPSIWGEKPKIAIVYAIGDCEMDKGIRARWLERLFLAIRHDPTIRAVVFRVDSPGGDAVASEIVAVAVKKCAENKPVIVSQGQLAASGGYLISAYGSRILAGPSTVTGSIGVIGGWLYDKGLTEKLGMTYDFVKRGIHADAGIGVRLPFIGQTISGRNLTDDEKALVKKAIFSYYDTFVGKVAEGRKMTVKEIDSLAQGHFYSGLRGKENGLVDEIGGLIKAIDIAVTEAGFESRDDVDVIEFPRSKGYFNFMKHFAPLPIRIDDDPFYRYLRLALENPYQPLPMLYPGTYPDKEK